MSLSSLGWDFAVIEKCKPGSSDLSLPGQTTLSDDGRALRLQKSSFETFPDDFMIGFTGQTLDRVPGRQRGAAGGLPPY